MTLNGCDTYSSLGTVRVDASAGHTMRASIIIPTYNRVDSLRRCLSAAGGQSYPDYEVIVVDDASTDGTNEMIAREFPRVRCLRQETNRAQIAARNRAMRVATGELFAFVDDDCIASPHWLAAHRRHYDDPRVGAVGGPLVPRAPSFYDKFYACHYRGEYEVTRRVERITAWERLVTGNMSVRRATLERVGVFDEQFVSGSDADLARRISRAGYAFVVDPAVGVEHLKTYSLPSFLRERFRKASGAILLDVKEGTVRMRRFVPILNPRVAWRDWRDFQAMFGATYAVFGAYWGLALMTRWADVSGRTYYFWTLGRRYQPRAPEPLG